MARTPEFQPVPDPRALDGPIRTCVGCRGRAAKSELVRLSLETDAHGRVAVVPDPDATAAGRGAYLHPLPECYRLAVRRRAFGRALRVPRDAGGLSSDAVETYFDSLDQPHRTDRNRSSSS